MYRTGITCFFVLASALLLSACDQRPWYLELGSANDAKGGEHVAVCEDGAILVLGTRFTPGTLSSFSQREGAIIVKFAASGIKLWETQLSSEAVLPQTLVPAADGGAFALTLPEDPHLRYNAFALTRITGAGKVMRQVHLEVDIPFPPGFGMTAVDRGGVLVFGATPPEVQEPPRHALYRFNVDGELDEIVRFPGQGISGMYTRAADSGYIAIAYNELFFLSNAFETINIIGYETRPTPELRFLARRVIVASNGDYLLNGIGYISSEDGLIQAGVVSRINEAGETLWARAFPELSPFELPAVVELANGNIAVVGEGDFSTTDAYYLDGVRVILLDAGGVKIGTRTYQKPFGFSLTPTDAVADGDYLIITGRAMGRVYPYRFDRLYLQRSLPLASLLP